MQPQILQNLVTPNILNVPPLPSGPMHGYVLNNVVGGMNDIIEIQRIPEGNHQHFFFIIFFGMVIVMAYSNFFNSISIVYSTDLPPVHIYQAPQEIISFTAETYIEPTPALDASRIPDIQTANQLPEVVESSTGQPLFVNIQPSQIAKVVIPHGSSSALIYGNFMLF